MHGLQAVEAIVVTEKSDDRRSDIIMRHKAFKTI